MASPDSRLEKTTNSRSPYIQEISEDIRQNHRIYHFQNCGTVCMSAESFNARGVRMENCGNNIPQVTYHHPRIIGNEKVIHSQSHAASNAPQNATSPLTAPTKIATKIAKSISSNVQLQTKALSPPQSPQPISPSRFSGDHTHHNIKYLEQLLDSSLATVAVIQYSGNTSADVLTPRACDALKALYALAALNAAASSTKREIPNCSSFCDNHRPYLIPFSNLAVSSTGRMHISISVDYVMLFSWAGLAVVSFVVVFFNLPRLCERDTTGLV